MQQIFKLCFIILLLSVAPVHAANFKPSIIYDLSGKFDKSFGESAYRGIERFKKEFGVQYKEFEITNEAQRELILQRFAEKSDLVIVVGFGFTTAVKDAAEEYKNVKFVTIDYDVNLPNTKAILFKEHEGCFLVGMIAALKSKSNKIGFIGGMDIPHIRKFLWGYKEGALYVKPNIEILDNMVGNTASAWNDPVKAGELAKSQIDRGADIIFAAAGESGLGVYQAAADKDVYAIGVDSNQNYLHPGHMLTSMVKRVDIAVYETLKNAMNNNFSSGPEYFGLKEGGVSFAIDEYNKSLISVEKLSKIETIKKQIISGKISVTDYTKSK